MAELSQHGYAAHRKARGLSGGSQEAVRKALRSGRITCLDPAIADAEWAASAQRPPEPVQPLLVQTSAPPPAERPMTPAQMLVQEKAQREQIKRMRESGEVISRDEVRQDVLELVTAVTAKLLLLPDELAPRMAAATDVAECRAVLDREIRRTLAELSRYEVAA